MNTQTKVLATSIDKYRECILDKCSAAEVGDPKYSGCVLILSAVLRTGFTVR